MYIKMREVNGLEIGFELTNVVMSGEVKIGGAYGTTVGGKQKYGYAASDLAALPQSVIDAIAVLLVPQKEEEEQEGENQEGNSSGEGGGE